jgi:hypothetical protein
MECVAREFHLPLRRGSKRSLNYLGLLEGVSKFIPGFAGRLVAVYFLLLPEEARRREGLPSSSSPSEEVLYRLLTVNR